MLEGTDGGPVSSSPVPSIAAVSDAGLGHPVPYVLDDIPLDETVSASHQALSQGQRVLRRECEDLADERQRL
jgi:hypothetical protein